MENLIKKEDWTDQIIKLENLTIQDIPDYLTKQEKIFDKEKFLKSHLKYIKANNGNKRFKPYLDRLNLLTQ